MMVLPFYLLDRNQLLVQWAVPFVGQAILLHNLHQTPPEHVSPQSETFWITKKNHAGFVEQKTLLECHKNTCVCIGVVLYEYLRLLL